MISKALEHCSHFEIIPLVKQNPSNLEIKERPLTCETNPHTLNPSQARNRNQRGIDFGVRTIAYHTLMHDSILTTL